MRAALLVAAEKREFHGLVPHLEGLAVLKWPIEYSCIAERGGRQWILVANGPGKRLARQAVMEGTRRHRVDLLVSTGYCGGLDPGLHPGEVIEAEQVIDEQSGEVYASGGRVHPAPARTGRLLTVDRVVITAGEKKALCERTGAQAVDMEAAAVAEAAREKNLPFACVRVVTDGAAEDLCMDFNRVRDASGRFHRGRIALQVAMRPWLAAPLLDLERRCRNAGRKLGDYLAACNF